LETTLGHKPLIIVAIVLSIGLAVLAIAEFVGPMQPEKPAVALAAQDPVRIVGPAFVPNVDPRKH